MKENRFNFDIKLSYDEYWDFELSDNETIEKMNLSCSNKIITDSLVLNVDISDINSWDLNTGYTLTSTSSSCDVTTKNIELLDWGLTQYDFGYADSLTASTTLSMYDTKFKFNRVGIPTGTANTQTIYTGFDITPVTGESVGNYFDLNGGWLNGFFKLEGYDYQLLPYRFPCGYTIQTWLNINEETFTSITGNTDGIFLFMGTRSENKYSIEFTGSTAYTTNNSVTVSGHTYQNFDQVLGESDYTTSVGDKLGSDHPDNKELGIEDNVIGFKLNRNKTLSYRTIDSEGLPYECTSDNAITSTGWTQVSIVFRPYKSLPIELIDCAEHRLGDLMIYVNGKLFWILTNFLELWFKKLNTEKEKQIGVPFNISWGGGTYGLNNSWHFNDFWERELPPTVLDELTGFTSNYDISYDTGLTLSGQTSLKITNPSNLLQGNVLFTYEVPFILETEKQYEFSLSLYDTELFYGTGCVRIHLSGDTTDFKVVNDQPYDGSNKLNWNRLNYKIETPITGGNRTVILQLIIDSPLAQVNPSLDINVDDIEFAKYNLIKNLYAQDEKKRNLLINLFYNGSFNGGLQVLRIYNRYLTVSEIIHNFNVEKLKYGRLENFGGRLLR